jgi:DNA-binding response OmpR family regulator
MRKPRVAVVEDDASVAEMIHKLLSYEGFEVVAISEGAGASVAVRDCACDAVILDVMLPGKDGLTILRELRDATATATLPIVMLTAKSDDATTWAGWTAGANYFMSKPFEPEQLIQALRSAMK